jgi:tRNA threonylcarbamoyladenosine biosynthesis protein TsaE
VRRLGPILNPNTVDLISTSVEQTQRFGFRLGQLLQPGDVVCLEGELGTGKTAFVRGLARALGVVDPVTSPTFTLMSEYRGPEQNMPLFHVDVYRLNEPDDVDGLGLWEYLYDDGVCAIEWADRIRSVLPPDRLWVTMRHYDIADNRRGIILEGHGERYLALLRDYKRSAFGV